CTTNAKPCRGRRETAATSSRTTKRDLLTHRTRRTRLLLRRVIRLPRRGGPKRAGDHRLLRRVLCLVRVGIRRIRLLLGVCRRGLRVARGRRLLLVDRGGLLGQLLGRIHLRLVRLHVGVLRVDDGLVGGLRGQHGRTLRLHLGGGVVGRGLLVFLVPEAEGVSVEHERGDEEEPGRGKEGRASNGADHGQTAGVRDSGALNGGALGDDAVVAADDAAVIVAAVDGHRVLEGCAERGVGAQRRQPEDGHEEVEREDCPDVVCHAGRRHFLGYEVVPDDDGSEQALRSASVSSSAREKHATASDHSHGTSRCSRRSG
ncbi:ffcefb59-4a6e-4eaa-8f6f-347a5b74fb83, partial [Thermothielavioides terrestris]